MATQTKRVVNKIIICFSFSFFFFFFFFFLLLLLENLSNFVCYNAHSKEEQDSLEIALCAFNFTVTQIPWTDSCVATLGVSWSSSISPDFTTKFGRES